MCAVKINTGSDNSPFRTGAATLHPHLTWQGSTENPCVLEIFRSRVGSCTSLGMVRDQSTSFAFLVLQCFQQSVTYSYASETASPNGFGGTAVPYLSSSWQILQRIFTSLASHPVVNEVLCTGVTAASIHRAYSDCAPALEVGVRGAFTGTWEFKEVQLGLL
jgi:hypothetical protein